MNSAANDSVQKHKVVFIMGATGTGKSRLSIDIATRFPAEIINSDKIQVYEGLDIVTNKISNLEMKGIPHHLLGQVQPNADFTATDFCVHAMVAMEDIVKRGKIPVIVGGSNSFMEALVEDPQFDFKGKYEFCAIWLDVSLPVLDSYVRKRVDQMCQAGLVEEVRGMFQPDADYTRGIYRAIGVPELDQYFRAEAEVDQAAKAEMLEEAIEQIKANTCDLVRKQLGRIYWAWDKLGWPLHRIDATVVFESSGLEADLMWDELVAKPSLAVANGLLNAF
ncbi:adenylate isopentenyltransferase 5, chloroplastic-like [Diospyros lotus]|uniref:adenylate isopentenyltransferase 5, chloroplastic-like n=1 Tax=Diospyros lotus TaxID=55363 RepID=UPI0022503D46|nr:adenylate isopentenyltransferase 5, chloroplastic-like [Diospyros lotus]